MKDFHRSFICQSTETGKKGHKNKHYSSKNETCKCFAPFLKLHYYDCPVARKPCPVHGCLQEGKDEKTKKKNMIVSFHPSSKTDRLFRPVKNLLVHCNSETNVNLEYYSPNSTLKDSVKHCQVQTNPDEMKKTLASNVFVEKTKSFITDKTNRMKRLKQCFHSPCNSIVAKTRSQTAVTKSDKIRDTFRVEVDRKAPEDPPDDIYSDKFKWTSSNKLDSSDWEKSSEDKMESDFVTVTKQIENKIIDHKIFEIKHKKEFGDIRFMKLPRESSLVYSSYGIEKSKNQKKDPEAPKNPEADQKKLEKYSKARDFERKDIARERSGSVKSHSSSSGSVYFTPFILVPPGVEGDLPKEPEKPKRANTENKGVKTEDSPEIKKSSESSSFSMQNSMSSKSTVSDVKKMSKAIGSGTVSSSSRQNSMSPKSTVSDMKKMDIAAGSGTVTPTLKYLYAPDELTSKSRIKEELQSLSDINNLNKATQVSSQSSTSLDEIYDSVRPGDTLRPEEEKRKPSIPPAGGQKREVSLVYDRFKNGADKITQTKKVVMKNVQVETVAPMKNKSQMTSLYTTKCVQTSFSTIDSETQSREFEADSDSNVTFVVSSSRGPEGSKQDNKSLWSKSHSDGDLYSKETDSAFQNICICENSETSNSELDSTQKIPIDKDNVSPVIQNGNVKSSVTKITKGEQTHLSDLSELAKMVDQFFDKMTKETFKSCECEKNKRKESITSPMKTGGSLISIKDPKTCMKDKEVQTTFKVFVYPLEEYDDPNKDNVCDDVFPLSDVMSTLLCKMRNQEDKAVVEASTTTDDLEKSPTPRTDTTPIRSSEIFHKMEKKTVSVCLSSSPSDLGNSFTKGQQMHIPLSSCADDFSDIPVVKVIPKETEYDSAKQTVKEQPVSAPASTARMKQSPQKEAPKETPYKPKPPVKKEPPKTSEANAKKTLKKPSTESWKSPDYCLLNSRKPIPGKVKSSIPTACGTPRRTSVRKEGEINTQICFKQPVEKKNPEPQKDVCPQVVSLKNRVSICECSPPNISQTMFPTPLSRNEPPNARNCDFKPPLPARQNQQQEGCDVRQIRNNVRQSLPKKPGRKNSMNYPVLIKPVLCTDVRKTLQILRQLQGCYFNESKSSILKQKKSFETEDESPGGKKTQGRDDGSGESFEPERRAFALTGKAAMDLRSGNGFVWIPSSGMELSKPDPESYLIGTQSEITVPKSTSQNSILFKGLSKRSAASTKSRRLKPVQVNEKHPFRKLFECRVCKSLSFLKTNQPDHSQNEQPSDFVFEFEPQDDSSISNDDNLQTVRRTFATHVEDEYVVACSCSSGRSESFNLSENSDLEDDREGKTELAEMNFKSPSSEIASRLFSMFRLGSDSPKE